MLRIIAGFWTAWGVLLLGFAETVVHSTSLAPGARAAVAAAGIAHVALAAVAWYGSGDPGRRRGIVALTILILVLRWVVDSYGVLGGLPARPAMFALGDLIVSVALLVGVLESLPRMLASRPAAS